MSDQKNFKKSRSSSVAVEPTPVRNSEVFRRRFSRTLSIYDEPESGSSGKTNGVTTNGSSGLTSSQDEEPSEYKYTSGYVRYCQICHSDIYSCHGQSSRFSDRKKAKEKEREESPTNTSSYYRRALDTNSSYGNYKRESPTSSSSQVGDTEKTVRHHFLCCQRAYGGRSTYSVNGEEENSRFSSGSSFSNTVSSNTLCTGFIV